MKPAGLYTPNSITYCQKSLLTHLNHNVAAIQFSNKKGKYVPIVCGLFNGLTESDGTKHQ